MSPAAEPALRLPYPGLRSFQRDESDLFFGREGTVNEMINRLRPNHFLAVLGTSGSGKSSLVRIGLLDGLELGLLAEAGSRWRIADFAPGANPLRNLAEALAGLSGGVGVDVDVLEAFLRRGPRSVIEWCKDGHLPKGANLLLLVDQFEELFRYQDYAERQAAEAFVAMLIESARNRDVPIYVVITMRSEYLGACALIEGLAEIINDGQFLTPRLNRDQCREAIVGPALVCGTTIEETLVNRLLNDLEDFAPWDDRDASDQLDRLVRRADQLPLLQHTLNRLWLRADAGRADRNQPIVLRLADYDAIGGLKGAINAHADEILATLGPSLQGRAEQVFRALTDGKSLATAVRRPLRFDELVAVCDGDETGVRAVVDAFRAPGVNFLRPDTSQPLVADTIIDISHESLIRQWRRLSAWVIDEAREGQEWTRLGESAARYRAGEGSLWRGQDLHQWRSHARPTAAWARRYAQPYDETLAFLDESIRIEVRNRRLRAAAIAAGFIVVVGFGGGGFFFSQLAGKNAALEAQQAELAAANDALVTASAELETNNAALVAAQADLAESVDRLQAAQAQLREVFLGSFDASVAAYQHGRDWTEAGALLGAMLDQTAHNGDAGRTYDDAVLAAARMRLAGQWSFAAWPELAPGENLARTTGTLQPAGRFGLLFEDVGEGATVRLVDLLTGTIRADTTLPDGLQPRPDGRHFISADGADAILVTRSGNAVRWHTSDGNQVDYGSVEDMSAPVVALAFDQPSGRLALLRYAEDSELLVFGSDGERLVSAPLAGIDGMDDTADNDEDAESYTHDGTGIAFWNGDILVSFDAGSRHRLGVVEGDIDGATLLPDEITAALPSDDGRWLFVETTAGCAPDAATVLVGPDGAVIDADGAPQTSCLAALDAPDGELDRFGAIPAGAAVAGVLSLEPRQESRRYRVVLDPGEAAGSAAPALLAIDFAEENGRFAPDEDVTADLAVGHAVPVRDATAQTIFAKASPVEAWLELPEFVPAASVSWFDPVAEESAPLFDVLLAPEGAMPSLSLRPSKGTWPVEKLGRFSDVHVAAGGNAILAVAGNQAGIQWINATPGRLNLREMTFGRECRFPVGEPLVLSQLLSWSARTPTFLGLDANGRVLRLSVVFGGGSTSTAGAGVLVNCIGQLRSDFTPAVIADPADEQVLLQVEPQAYVVLTADIETEKGFNEAAVIRLPAASAHAAFIPDETPALASLDRAGNLTVMRADPEWRVASALRSIVVADPVHVAASGDALLTVGEGGRAVVVDLSSEDLLPVAAGIVPPSDGGYRLLPDGLDVEALVSGKLVRVPLSALPPPEELARYAEAGAAELSDSSDQDQVSLGARLTRRDDEAIVGGSSGMALGGDARCYLAANAVLEAWRAEAGQGAPGARLEAARSQAADQCIGASALAETGRRLAAASHFVSPAFDAWPSEWSLLLGDALAGNRLAARAILIGLANSTDPLASAAGEWFAASQAAFGLELPAEVFESAASGSAVSPDLALLVEAQRESYEPAIHELLGHIAARRASDPEQVKEAWIQFRIAEVLYKAQIGRAAEAERTGQLRSRIARSMSANDLLAAWNEVGGWTADVAASTASTPAIYAGTPAERIRADAERIAASEQADEADAPFRLLQAYLWFNLAEADSASNPSASAGSYARFANIMTSLPPAEELPAPLAAALADAASNLVTLASSGRLGDPATATRLAPFILGLAEPQQEGLWDAAALRAYAGTMGALTGLVAEGRTVPQDVLDRLRFAERRFGHGFRVESDDEREAAGAALAARLGLLDALLARDPSRSDWMAAKGTTEFWVGYRLHADEPAEKSVWLTRAIRDLEAAQAAADGSLPPESLYWLTEARRWLPPAPETSGYLDLVAGGTQDYEALRVAYEGGDWDAPAAAAELFASNAELLAKIADARGELVFDRGDDWSASDATVQTQILDGLAAIADWDEIREMAISAGSTWTSLSPGFAIAPGYLFGTVAGHASALAGNGDACDAAASFAGDPLRRAPAVAFGDIDIAAALSACRAIWGDDPDDARLSYLVSRLAGSTPEGRDEALDALQTAAEAGYPAAFNSLAGYLEDAGDAIPDSYALEMDARHGYAQRVIATSFADVYAYLAPLAVTDEQRKGLRWLLTRAADLGSPDAHLVLSRLPDISDSDRYYHMEVAALQLEEAGREDEAEEIRAEIPAADYVDAADRAEDEFRVERLVGLGDGVFDLLRGVTN